MRLELTDRPVLIDYSSLRVHRPISKRLAGRAGQRPIVLLVASVLFLSMALLPLPRSLVGLVEEVNPLGYKMMEADSETIVESVNRHFSPEAFGTGQGDSIRFTQGLKSSSEIARRAMIMIGILLVAVLLWATEALPIGGTAVLVAVLMYVFNVLSPQEIPKAFMNDSVLFIMGILAVAVGVSKTGLDKRIGFLLLSRIRSAGAFAFIFIPLLAVSAAFLSAHALVALLVPVLMGVYKATCAANGVKQDRTLAIFLLLGLVFAANIGGPGSPAAGARNAIMVAYLADAGYPIGFGEWMKLGMPLVPVLALTVGAYMYVRCKPKLLVRNVNPSEAVNREVANLPKFGGKEAIMAAILGMLIATWVTLDDRLGLGGATLVAVSVMFVFSIISWRDVRRGVAFDVVALYAAAGAIAVGLSFTSGGLWLATRILDMLPAFLSEGDGLVMGVSVLTVLLTNVMSDGATVGTLGPVVLPMADLGHASIWKVGLITSFASSFANVLVVGTPDNAIAFAMSKDPETGRKLLSVFDFIKYGLPLTVLLMIVMWGWALFGYWSIQSWP